MPRALLACLFLLAGCGLDPNGGSGSNGIVYRPMYDDPFAMNSNSMFGMNSGSMFGRGPYSNSLYGSQSERFFYPARNVTCDRQTRICYRGDELDESETRDWFGRRDARRADNIRDAAGTNEIFVPRGNVYCDLDDKVCYKNGHPDRSETRDYFGKKAARRID
ncbi:MAG: hypothetical protein U1E45_16285 [Geminicoccaceae bacterium]